jgi:hypothetical protein
MSSTIALATLCVASWIGKCTPESVARTLVQFGDLVASRRHLAVFLLGVTESSLLDALEMIDNCVRAGEHQADATVL